MAAVEAGRMGKSVVLIEPSAHVGGMTAGGLGSTDIGDINVVRGLTREFYGKIYHYYHPVVADSSATALQWQFEPHVAEAIFLDMLQSAGVTVVRGERLDREGGVAMVRTQIKAITMESGRLFQGRVFIDATYEGDLMAAAGVSYRVGREAITEYNEPLNGVYPERRQPTEVDPFVIPGQPSSGLLPGVEQVALGSAGSADGRVQRYNLRVCLTNDPKNRLPLTQPAEYSPQQYELLARYFAQHPTLNLQDVLKLEPIPDNKVDLNSNGFFSSDMPGPESSTWAEANYADRMESYRHYLTYTQGLLWFLANDERVPASVRQQAQYWGPAADEFGDNDHWPLQVYVREARRMRGAFTVTQHDCEGAVATPEPVAFGSYGMDSHTVTLYADAEGVLHTEGFFFGSVTDYPISYRAMTPVASECTNLLVPVCVSASHVAFDSIRIEPTFMMLGQAAGAAASLASQERTPVQQVNYRKLAEQLQLDGPFVPAPRRYNTN